MNAGGPIPAEPFNDRPLAVGRGPDPHGGIARHDISRCFAGILANIPAAELSPPAIGKDQVVPPNPPDVRGVLVAAFESDLRCERSEAELLAEMALVTVPGITGSEDDTPEDLVVRLRDPRIFGAFAETVTRAPRLPNETRIAVAEHAFDLLSLPRAEGDVFLVASRAPPRLLALAAFLLREDAFTVLHLMHLVYAVFLDRGLVRNVEPAVRSAVVASIAADPGIPEHLRVVYVVLHAASLDDDDAEGALRELLNGPAPPSMKDTLASLVTQEDGGAGELAQRLRDEGLLPETAVAGSDPLILANIPRLSDRVRRPAEEWIRRGGTRSRRV